MLDALAVVEGRPCRCSEQDSCCDCAFRPDTIQCQCNSEYGMMIKRTWLYSNMAEATLWDKVPVNARILVSMNGQKWEKRHYAGRVEDGRVGSFGDGRTSWTREDNEDITFWRYAVLAENA
ncbi:Uncharacterised protein [uncultured Clostridium sp.]|nr:Uncharacterised protein [uncultured Clostridium sp.]